MMKKGKSLIGITMGDPAGIGPEVICKLFMRKEYKKFCNILVLGNKFLFDKTIHYYRYKIKTEKIENPEEVYLLQDYSLGIIDMPSSTEITNFYLGKPEKLYGQLALNSIDKAIDLAYRHKIDAMVTAPVNKEIIALSHKKFIGHTEYIADKLKVTNFNMMMVSKMLKVVLVTTHIAIKNITKNITKDKILKSIENANKTMMKLGNKNPSIAVLGLNPHASDGGLFGEEEERIIIPAIEEAKAEGIHCEGPFPADAFFAKHMNAPRHDVVIAMYHDQGLIPLKMNAFGSGTNVTIGLPIIRTSVAHGTAYDIAGKNIANDRSLFEAVKFASDLVNNN